MEIFASNTDEYSLKIEEVIKKGANKSYNMYRDSVNFQNKKLSDIIAFTTDKPIWLIATDNQKALSRKLNLTYKNKAETKTIDKKFINQKLEEIYKFRIDTFYRPIKVWNLIIEDTVKLGMYRTDSISGNYLQFTADSAIIYRVSLGGIAYAIEHSKRKIVLMKKHPEGRFNIRLNAKDTTELKQELSLVYGIKLEDTVAVIQHFHVVFDDKR